MFNGVKVKVKVRLYLYIPGEALRFPGGLGSNISRKLLHEDDNVVSSTHRPPLPPRKFFGTYFC
jgi:hypothetical protein